MERAIKLLVITSLVLAFIVVVLGAYTRLVDAGLGCPDWPTCYGHLWVPKSAEDVALANERFAHAPVEHDKTWPEQTHRIFAASLGVFFIVIVAVSAYLRFVKQQGMAFWHPLLMLVLIVCQGLFGMWTVTLLLWPQVVVSHLLGGFATVSLLFLLWLRLQNNVWVFCQRDSYWRIKRLRPLLLILLAVVVLQIFLGGWTAANYAAVACADFPKCHDQWWPQADFMQGFNLAQQIGPNYLGGQLDNHARTAIHLLHRVGAVVVAAISLVTAALLLRIYHAKVMQAGMVLLFAVIVQLLLGVSNIVFALPLAVAVAHNAMAALLLLVIIYINYQVHTAVFSNDAAV